MKKIISVLLVLSFALILLPVQVSAMQIFVLNVNNGQFTLEVEPTDRMIDVKAKLQEKTGTPAVRQHLFFGGKELLNEETLQDYSIQKDSTLQLFVGHRLDLSAGSITITATGYQIDSGAETACVGPYLVVQSNQSPTANTVTVTPGTKATIALAGVNIASGANNALDFAGAQATVVLLKNMENNIAVSHARPDDNPAGIHVPAGASLTLTCNQTQQSGHRCDNFCGELNVTAGQAAHIGGNAAEDAGTIIVRGGQIAVADGMSLATGIGGGFGGGDGGLLVVTGGILNIGTTLGGGMGGGGEEGAWGDRNDPTKYDGGNGGNGGNGGDGGRIYLLGGEVTIGAISTTLSGIGGGNGGIGGLGGIGAALNGAYVGVGGDGGDGGRGGDSGYIAVAPECTLVNGDYFGPGPGGVGGRGVVGLVAGNDGAVGPSGESSAVPLPMTDEYSANFQTNTFVFAPWLEANTKADFSGNTLQSPAELSGQTVYLRRKSIGGSAVSAAVEVRFPLVPDERELSLSGLADGQTVVAGTRLRFTAVGAGLTNQNPIDGDERILPTGWKINPRGSWTAAPYTAEVDTSALAVGTHVLQITYQRQRYTAGRWVPVEEIVQSVSFTLAGDPDRPTTDDPDRPTNGDPDRPTTGDQREDVIPVLLCAAGIFVAAVLLRRRRKA